jgi:putative FmdB family regulatory protein
MPIFEYECRACGHEFERLVRTGDVPACPSCNSQDLEKLLSLSSISTDSISKANIKKAREAAKPMQRDKAMAEADEIREHYGEHYPNAMQPGKPGQRRPFRKK